MSEFKGVRAFLMIPPSISRDKELLKKPKSIILMGEIISMLNVTGEFFMSNKKIAEHLRVSARQVNRYLDLLEKKKLIEREKVVSDKNGAILGRKIHAGSALMTCMSLGWRTECHEGNDTDVIPLVSQTSHKYNSLIDQSNITVNKSSSSKSSSEAQDPFAVTAQTKEEEDQKINQLIKWFIQKTDVVLTNSQYNQINNQLHQMTLTDANDLMHQVVDTMTAKIRDPAAYLIKSLMNAS